MYVIFRDITYDSTRRVYKPIKLKIKFEKFSKSCLGIWIIFNSVKELVSIML